MPQKTIHRWFQMPFASARCVYPFTNVLGTLRSTVELVFENIWEKAWNIEPSRYTVWMNQALLVIFRYLIVSWHFNFFSLISWTPDYGEMFACCPTKCKLSIRWEKNIWFFETKIYIEGVNHCTDIPFPNVHLSIFWSYRSADSLA